MSVGFVLPRLDAWTRVVGAIALLGALALPGVWRRRHSLLRVDPFGILVGLASGLLLYLVARWMAELGAVADQIARVSAWRSGHSVVTLSVTLLLAVVSEELFWRGEITRALAARAPKWSAALVSTALFSVAHAASGTWLLPVAAAGIVLTWNLLFLVTGSLIAPLASHLVFDVLAMLIAPLG
jgi:membrane protease YdiL (CAAX protease family)